MKTKKQNQSSQIIMNATKKHASSSSPIEAFLNKNSTFYYATVSILSLLILGLVIKNSSFDRKSSKSRMKNKEFDETTTTTTTTTTIQQNIVTISTVTIERSYAKELFLQAQRQDEENYVNNNISGIEIVTNIKMISPPKKCFDKQDEKNFNSTSVNTQEEMFSLERKLLFSSSSSSNANVSSMMNFRNRKISASTIFRLIPRSDALGSTETRLFQNISADDCALRCVKLGPRLCTFFVRTLPKEAIAENKQRHVILSDKKNFQYEFLMKSNNKKIKKNQTISLANQILHPMQANTRFLFATMEEEEEARNPVKTSSTTSNNSTFGSCSLRVGILDPIADLSKFGIYVPAWVSEDTKSTMMVPGELSPKSGRYENCKAAASSLAKQHLIKRTEVKSPSSLLAVGLLAGAPYLHERVMPALWTWLRQEPNLIAFVDRTPSAMRKVKKILSRSLSSFLAAAKTLNPLFACVSPSSLRTLYREFPEAGGDALYPGVVDEELTDEIFVSDQGKRLRMRFCNPEKNSSSSSNRFFEFPGITFPISTSSLFAQNSSSSSSSKTSGVKQQLQQEEGFVMFRFIREPDHEVLRLFNGAWKNYIILYELPIFYPTAFWYLTVDDDSMVLFRNLRYNLLLASLSNLHRRDDIYAGHLEYGDNFFFVHGGGGVLLSSATAWKLHDKLPSCLPICRQAYGDVRVACCLHSMDIYERRLKFLFPFILEKAPERWTNMLTSLHKYQSRNNILSMWNSLENIEWRRKMQSVLFEKTRYSSSNVSKNNQFRAEFFNTRRNLFSIAKKIRDDDDNKNRNNNIYLFDELLWAAESWRVSKSVRRR